MWNPDEKPTLSLADFAKELGMSYRNTKAMVEERERLADAKMEQTEKLAAIARYKQGPRRVNEELGDAAPEVAMSRRRWVQLFRASKMQKGCRGGELHNDDDFVKWLLKRCETMRIKVACAQNRTGYLPTLERAKAWGEKERAGRTLIDPTTGGYVHS